MAFRSKRPTSTSCSTGSQVTSPYLASGGSLRKPGFCSGDVIGLASRRLTYRGHLLKPLILGPVPPQAAVSSSRLRGRSSAATGDRGWQVIQSQVGALDQEHGDHAAVIVTPEDHVLAGEVRSRSGDEHIGVTGRLQCQLPGGDLRYEEGQLPGSPLKAQHPAAQAGPRVEAQQRPVLRWRWHRCR